MNYSSSTSGFKLSGFRLSLVLIVGLGLVAGISFWLGQISVSDKAQQAEMRQSELRELEQSHTQVLQQKHQLQTRLTLAELEAASQREQLDILSTTLAEQATSLSFYQNVMAPETIQDRFIVDGLQIFEQSTPNHYKMEFVLLQRLERRSLIKGNLQICIRGEQGQTLCSGSPALLPEGDIAYGFKFFQTVSVAFTLPEAFEPVTVSFSSQVYQYSKKREDYKWQVDWKQVFTANSPS
ncbi:hypothetical protein IT774_03075 [Salinimonas marina]|uniref:Uncharacterized protein n=1 Tax=Salinimonas marina TaxID=2785918 RepID=A0A7S9DYH9_9ALTE|nr:DUF6776 family protein [Salinimonas marina]QPG06210.1 hypothetical protein IT774_03075 [Salinimonas marina]